MPTVNASPVASGEMMSTMREPAITRLNTSRASLSPPKR